jgi:hypothetical protein
MSKTIDEQLHDLAREYIELIASEPDFDERERLLEEHQRKHDELAKMKQ